MNSLLTKIRDKHALWYKGIIFVFCVIICTYLLPKKPFWHTNPPKTNDVWQHENLISDIDFLVKKTHQELEQEKHTSAQQNNLYFKKQPINVEEQINQLPLTLGSHHKQALQSYLDTVYKTGFYFSISGKTPVGRDSIYLVSGNEVELVSVANLFNEIKVKERLKSYLNDAEIADLFLNHFPMNIVYDEELNKTIFSSEELPKNIYKAKIKKGDVIIHKNDIITDEQANLVDCYKQELNSLTTSNTSVVLGQLLSCALILGIMMLFLAFFRKAIFSQNTHVTFIFLVIILIVISSNAVYQYNARYIFAVPFCLVPVLIRVFFDSRTALFNFLNVVLLCSFFTSDKFEFVFIQLITGIGTIFSVADMGKRSKLFVSAMLTFVFYISSYAAYHLVNDTSVMLNDLNNYIPFLISSLCVLFSFPLIFLFEKLFGFVSDFTLLELCDLNSPLLRQLSQKVPGTFQHSLQVANLAEEACYKIGGNALLVRTGAMYHDIGKMEHPRFFTENQVGEVSPHEDLSAEESAQIIIEHVIKGVEIAKANKLPELIIDFIRTHHGTTTTRYFLHNYKKQHEGEKINEDLFRYPGPIPFSKETAILMMADGVEASSRSLKKYDAIAIDELVDRIIDYQIGENQFLNADITFRDINQIKKIFKKRLMNIYHVRIEYPR